MEGTYAVEGAARWRSGGGVRDEKGVMMTETGRGEWTNDERIYEADEMER